MRSSNVIIKYADDTTVIGQIANNDESAYSDSIITGTLVFGERLVTL